MTTTTNNKNPNQTHRNRVISGVRGEGWGKWVKLVKGYKCLVMKQMNSEDLMYSVVLELTVLYCALTSGSSSKVPPAQMVSM